LLVEVLISVALEGSNYREIISQGSTTFNIISVNVAGLSYSFCSIFTGEFSCYYKCLHLFSTTQ
jgi:hypothetical protein